VAEDQEINNRRIELWLNVGEGQERGFVELSGSQEFGEPVDFDVHAGDTDLHISYQFVYGVLERAEGTEGVIEYPVDVGDYGLFMFEHHELKRDEQSLSSGMVLAFARVFGNREHGAPGHESESE
jgi:hypothetical protein